MTRQEKKLIMTMQEENAQNQSIERVNIEEKVRNNLIVERQRLIGFAASEASCDLFAIFLHKKNLISPGFNINHRFFSSEKIAWEKFEFDFPKKNELIPLLVKQEGYRSILCYGKSKERENVEEAIKNLYGIKRLAESISGEIV
mgnify:CR=1 FL=1